MLWQTSAARPPPDGARVLPGPRRPLDIDKNNYMSGRFILFSARRVVRDRARPSPALSEPMAARRLLTGVFCNHVTV